MFADKLFMNTKILKNISLLILSGMLYISSGCGGGLASEASSALAESLQVSVFPSEPLVIPADRPINLLSTDSIIVLTLAAPNVQFRLELDNKLGDQPITIITARVEVTGPKGLKNMYFHSTDLYRVITEPGDFEGSFVFTNRAVIAEVPAGQKTSCMDKVNYLEIPVTNDCPINTEQSNFDGTNYTTCCPTMIRSLADQWAILTQLQDGMTEEELADPSAVFHVYQFNVTLIGWVGTFALPEQNFRKQFQFQSSGF